MSSSQGKLVSWHHISKIHLQVSDSKNQKFQPRQSCLQGWCVSCSSVEMHMDTALLSPLRGILFSSCVYQCLSPLPVQLEFITLRQNIFNTVSAVECNGRACNTPLIHKYLLVSAFSKVLEVVLQCMFLCNHQMSPVAVKPQS